MFFYYLHITTDLLRIYKYAQLKRDETSGKVKEKDKCGSCISLYGVKLKTYNHMKILSQISFAIYSYREIHCSFD